MCKSIFGGLKFAALFDHVKQRPTPSHVPRLQRLDRETFIQDVESVGLPVVFPFNPAPGREWVLRRLRKLHGRQTLQVRIGRYADVETYPLKRQTVDITLAEYLDSLDHNHDRLPPYAGNQQVRFDVLADLGLAVPWFHEPAAYEPPVMWLGPAGATPPLHKDGSDNFAVHIFGSKRWILFPVRDAPLLDMQRVYDDPWMDFATSLKDLREPETLEHLVRAGASPLSVTVLGGEILYLPAGWSHYVVNLESTLMVNQWLGRMTTPGVLKATSFEADRTGVRSLTASSMPPSSGNAAV